MSSEKSAPTIALCAIVKNEADCLAAMLTSVLGLVEQIIVVDTGSSDNTVEIAENSGAIVKHFTWCDNFAAARNYSLQFATTEWILVLDGDERLESSDHSNVRELVTKPDVAYYLQRRHYTNSPLVPHFTALAATDPARTLGASGYFTTNDIRLFRNDPDIRYDGLVHETVEDRIIQLTRYKIEKSSVLIHHVGPLAAEHTQQEKRALYLKLAKDKVEQNPDDWRNWYQLGAECQTNLLLKDAVLCFTEASNRESSMAQNWRQLGLCQAALGNHHDALAALNRALQLDSNCHSTWLGIGVSLLELGRVEEAELSLQTALGLAPGHPLVELNLERVREMRGV